HSWTRLPNLTPIWYATFGFYHSLARIGRVFAMLLLRGWYESGDWTRGQPVEMDSRFCEALERAFRLGIESRAAARATVGAFLERVALQLRGRKRTLQNFTRVALASRLL